MEFIFSLVRSVILFGLLVFVAFRIFRILRPFEKGLIERFGKYNREATSGLNIVIPGIERLIVVDMREQVIDVPPQEVITKDNVTITVDAVIYYEPTDPKKLVYNVGDFITAATKLAQTNLRNVIGDLELDAALTSRETINTSLKIILDEATDKWGTRVVRVEIQRIDPPQDVQDAMNKVMKAERDRRAAVTEAEGEKRAAILTAEGERQSQILSAEGEAEALKAVADAQKYEKIAIADGESEAIQKVFDAIHKGDPTNDLIAIKYLESLEKVANGKATKIFLPADLSATLGSIGAVAELFKDDDSKESKKSTKK
ncbi:SPFH/Band 7/PHB domain protein [Acidimicrobiaceae bacterium]|nr:SPFH/Band 7/PHB domain protein [Acidimicrobiaceae bacterium]MDC3103684.1 SPFH/Band 7/PHB domain protein [Acidimicrobiaceae bacterium]|tara:strand:+ start:363 stop:1307 length:945 start_codon:yes stop_codon:yes gene_type:complete